MRTSLVAKLAGEVGELLVRDEAPLLGAARLDRGEELALVVLGEVEPELGRLDPDRVDAALLAEHDRALGRDELRGVRLDRGRVVELARDRSALAAEERLADKRLPRLELVAGELADALGDLPRAVEPEARLLSLDRV